MYNKFWAMLGWHWVYWYQQTEGVYGLCFNQGWKYKPDRWKKDSRQYALEEMTNAILETVYFWDYSEADRAFTWVITPERTFIWFEYIGTEPQKLPTAWIRKSELLRHPPPGRQVANNWEIANATVDTFGSTYFLNESKADQAWNAYEKSVISYRKELRKKLSSARKMRKHCEIHLLIQTASEQLEHWTGRASEQDVAIESLVSELAAYGDESV